MHEALAATATLLSVAFAMFTYERWLGRHRRHELVWTIALVMFALGSFGLWLGAALGWSEWSFKAFYLFGAILNVPFLALGTVYLLGGQRRGDVATAVVCAAGGLRGRDRGGRPAHPPHRGRHPPPGLGGVRHRPAHRRRRGLRRGRHRHLRGRHLERGTPPGRPAPQPSRPTTPASRPVGWPRPTW